MGGVWKHFKSRFNGIFWRTGYGRGEKEESQGFFQKIHLSLQWSSQPHQAAQPLLQDHASQAFNPQSSAQATSCIVEPCTQLSLLSSFLLNPPHLLPPRPLASVWMICQPWTSITTPDTLWLVPSLVSFLFPH